MDRKQDPRRRATAVLAVATVHAVLAVGLMKGLDIDFKRIVSPPVIGEQIPLPPPPEPKPTPPEPTDQHEWTPTNPLPPIPFPLPPTPVPESHDDETPTDSGPTLDPFPPPQPPRPSPSFTPTRAVPRNGTSGWISTDDYPRQPLMNGIEGSVGYRLVIGTSGRVASCELTRPSGNRALDNATCRLITTRARFEPATDETGAKVLGTFTGSVRWDIPD
jgi:protein TonB